jgi:hypothetical protein
LAASRRSGPLRAIARYSAPVRARVRNAPRGKILWRTKKKKLSCHALESNAALGERQGTCRCHRRLAIHVHSSHLLGDEMTALRDRQGRSCRNPR